MHDQLLAVIDNTFHVRSSAGKAVIEIGEAPLVTAVNEKAIYQRGEVITRSAVHRPLTRKLLTRLQDFFHYRVEQGALVHPIMLAKSLLQVQLDSIFRERAARH